MLRVSALWLCPAPSLLGSSVPAVALPRPQLLGPHLSQSPRLFHPGSLGLIQVTRTKCPANLIYFPGVLQLFVVCLPVYLLFVNICGYLLIWGIIVVPKSCQDRSWRRLDSEAHA